MNAPLFSVIIPTYGRPEFLAEAIDSVLVQTVDDLECIVVDDASPEPVEIPVDERVRLVRRTENGGPGAARNSGIKQARGKYITFLDDDDLYAPARLEMATRGLSRSPIAICWSRYQHEATGSNRRLEGNVHDTILNGLTPHLGATAIHREAVELFDERLLASQDVEWWLRVTERFEVTTSPGYGNLIRKHNQVRGHTSYFNRIRFGIFLVSLHRAYFEGHPRAEAFRWKRLGLMAQARGDHRLARSSFRRSFRLAPSLRTLGHLARSARISTDHIDTNVTPLTISNIFTREG